MKSEGIGEFSKRFSLICAIILSVLLYSLLLFDVNNHKGTPRGT